MGAEIYDWQRRMVDQIMSTVNSGRRFVLLMPRCHPRYTELEIELQKMGYEAEAFESVEDPLQV